MQRKRAASSFERFLQAPLMKAVAERSAWAHFEVPGQGYGADTLATSDSGYHFPTFDAMADAVEEVIVQLS